MSGSCRGQETGEGFDIWGGKGLEVPTAHDPVLHMILLMCNAHEHYWLPSTILIHVSVVSGKASKSLLSRRERLGRVPLACG